MPTPPKKQKMSAKKQQSTPSTDSQQFDSQELKVEKVPKPYKFLTATDLMPEMDVLVEKCADFLGYPPTICRILLHHFKWFDEALMEKFYEYDNLDAFFKKLNMTNQKEMRSETDDFFGEECSICFTRCRLTCLECGHKFCYDCWNSYLEEQVKTKALPYVTCPEYKCQIVLSDKLARELMIKDSTEKAYDNLILKSFVESNRLLRWCPGKECDRVVKLLEGVPQLNEGIECPCKMLFCYACGLEWHEPMKCDLTKVWLKQCEEDKGTYTWLNMYTKDCPKCNAAIEKNGGCNHMTCRTCHYEFCWICMGDWKAHMNGGYNCNRYNETKEATDTKHQNRAAMERYLHYYTRYTNHQNSLKLEEKLLVEVNKSMLFLQSKGYAFIETCFMKDAVGVLNRCRRSLSYTYGFAYYSDKSNQVAMFEDNQENLELATEVLSGLLERDLIEYMENEKKEKNWLQEFKTEVMDKAHYVDTRRTILLDHCAEGYEHNYWKFVDRKE